MDCSKAAEQAIRQAAEERDAATGLAMLFFGAGCFVLGLIVGASVAGFAWAVMT